MIPRAPVDAYAFGADSECSQWLLDNDAQGSASQTRCVASEVMHLSKPSKRADHGEEGVEDGRRREDRETRLRCRAFRALSRAL